MYFKFLRTLNDGTITYRFSAIVAVRYLSTMQSFQKDLKTAKKIAVLTGAGISAESGIPTYRLGSNVWRNLQSASLATPEAFKENPGLVWEFYHYKRERALKAVPNAAHKALVNYERRHIATKKMVVITQNVDNLHTVAGSKNIIELHGNLFRTRCTKCNDIQPNFDSPISRVFAARQNSKVDLPRIPVQLLPHCKKQNCNGLLRPDIMWFGEDVKPVVLAKAEEAIDTCNMCLVIGTSSVMYPAAALAPRAAARGAVVAEFNIYPSPVSEEYQYYFSGPCGQILPKALSE